jgi:hypothetical protein
LVGLLVEGALAVLLNAEPNTPSIAAFKLPDAKDKSQIIAI